jgi:nucleolar protein 12
MPAASLGLAPAKVDSQVAALFGGGAAPTAAPTGGPSRPPKAPTLTNAVKKSTAAAGGPSKAAQKAALAAAAAASAQANGEQRKRPASTKAAAADVAKPKKRSATAAPASKPADDADGELGDDPERLARTVFVGNVPVATTRKQISRHFAQYGDVERVFVRSAAPANPKLPPGAALITGTVDAAVRDSVNAFVVFAAAASANAATAANGEPAFGRHLRIDSAAARGSAAPELNTKCSVFLGNLPFDTQEEALWALFGGCGTVANVRLVRDARTQQGKGFGYVTFAAAASVEQALDLHGTAMTTAAAPKGRALRVFRCSKSKSMKRQHERDAVVGRGGRGGAGGRGGGGRGGGGGGEEGAHRRLKRKHERAEEAERAKKAARAMKALGRPKAAPGSKKHVREKKLKVQMKKDGKKRAKMAAGKLPKRKGNKK